jgi:peptidoglycan hydrolase-like protein with peptidoglycan-binding domain
MATTPYETQAIYNLQRYLRQLSRFDPDIPSVDEDGIFGEETRASLAAFQRKYGLPVTGTADGETWARLFNEYLASVEERTRPLPVYLFPRFPTDYSIGRGDENLLTGVVQLLLREALILYGKDADSLPIDGKFEEQTERAVKDFQTVQRLPADGRVDRITWNRLAQAAESGVNGFPRES